MTVFVSKVESLLFNMLFCNGFFFPKEQTSFNFMAAVPVHSDFGAPQIKSATVSTISPFICCEVMGPDAMILVF